MEKKITEEMFAQPNAGEVILNLVREGAYIDNEAQLKVFGLPDEKAAEILLEYIKSGWTLCKEAQLKVFELPDEKAAEIMLENVKHGRGLCDEAQFKIFALPNAAEILLEYVKHGNRLSPEAQRKIFGLPQDERKEILLEHIMKGRGEFLGNETWNSIKSYELPNADEIDEIQKMLRYIRESLFKVYKGF